MALRPFRAFALVAFSMLALSLPSFAKEGDSASNAWMKQCISDANLSLEGATTFCQCLWDKVGPENVPPLKLLRDMNPAEVESCTTVGPKPWIRQCITDSKMAKEAGTKYCQCIWDKIGPENVPPLDVLKDMDSDVLTTCKK